MIRRPPRSTRTDTLFPTRRSSDLTRPSCRCGSGFKASTSCWSRARVYPPSSWLPGSAFLRSEEHTSELQSLMRISYAVFCLTKTKITCRNKLLYYKQELLYLNTQHMHQLAYTHIITPLLNR